MVCSAIQMRKSSALKAASRGFLDRVRLLFNINDGPSDDQGVYPQIIEGKDDGRGGGRGGFWTDVCNHSAAVVESMSQLRFPRLTGSRLPFLSAPEEGKKGDRSIARGDVRNW